MTNTQKVAQSAAMIAIFTLISKFLGFLREILIAYTYGSGYETDTYFLAMTATVIIMTIVGAALNTTLVPIFTEIDQKRGKEGKLEFLNNILNMIFFLSIILALLGFVFSPKIIKILARGFEGEQFQLAVKLNRIGLPIIVFLGFTYVFSGFLHSSEIFGPPAIMGLPYNLVFIIFLVFFAKEGKIESLMLVSVIAASTQFLIQLPAVKYQGYKYSLDIDLKDPYLQKALFLVIPVLIGSAVHQLNIIVDKTLASGLAEGSISALTYSSRINDLIISVFVMAITTVVFPMLSKAFNEENYLQVKKIMGLGINIILIVTVPATIGIILLAEPMIKIFFERGAFTETATLMTSKALVFYSLGLIGSSIRMLLNRVYYSFQDTRSPMINGITAVAANIGLNLLLIDSMGHAGLALATSISTTFASLLLFINIRKQLGRIGIRQYLICFFKSLFASIIMGVVVYLIFFKITPLLPAVGIIELLMLLLSVAVGVLLYIIICSALGIREIRILINTLLKKIKA
ncbi:MAG: murein biosynthesis integral membrane protein MurJ [Tissierellia bacterium]|nr:murein biosynthesis integral membrane protein MurJ [Tissierellia bacterium]